MGEMNKGADILRDQFTPETAFTAIHNLLSILTQNVSDDVDDRPGCVFVQRQLQDQYQYLIVTVIVIESLQFAAIFFLAWSVWVAA